MSKSSETTTTSSGTTSGSGTTTGGGGGKGPNPKRVLEITLLFIILALVAYDTYMISQNHQALQNLQVAR
ncbi:MAG TPA: hypothetical protein VHB70_17690 [Parafilimonas sp.]|nr:hypothetical protein [Parafilimonas sp.]